MHKDIKAWLKATENQPTAYELERDAAIAWHESLTEDQQHVFDKLLDGTAGMLYLRVSREQARIEKKKKR